MYTDERKTLVWAQHHFIMLFKRQYLSCTYVKSPVVHLYSIFVTYPYNFVFGAQH